MVRLVVKQGLAVSLAGAAAGLVAAWGLSRLLQQLLFGVTPLDPITLAGAPATLLVVAGLATVIPSWKASKTDPAAALRQD